MTFSTETGAPVAPGRLPQRRSCRRVPPAGSGAPPARGARGDEKAGRGALGGLPWGLSLWDESALQTSEKTHDCRELRVASRIECIGGLPATEALLIEAKRIMNYRLDFFDDRGSVRDRVEFSAVSDSEALRISVGHIVHDPCADRQCGYELWRDALRLKASGIGHAPETRRQRRQAPGWLSARAMRELVRRGFPWLVRPPMS